MLKIVLLKGLPASGKSTWAKKKAEDSSHKRVNKDDLRAMLGGKFSRFNEKFVLKVRDFIVKEALRSGKHAIVDDTNLHPKHKIRMDEIADEMRKEGINVVVEEKFFDVDVEECIKRDLKRSNSVGSQVIYGMYNRFLNDNVVEKKQHDALLPNCIICDVDGTLAIKSDRSPYDWARVKEDTLNDAVANHVKMLAPGIRLIIFTGRDGSCETETREWLAEHQIEYDEFYIRPTGDMRKDAIIKEEMYRAHIEGKYNVLYVLDDRDQVVDMWRKKLGLDCFQVNYGSF